ncbi:MAG: squalene synthase HpnC, partial [Burkholderiaceae bacterium]
MQRVTDTYRKPSDHYENFPVASWLCPPTLRAPIAAIYWYARSADDIADEGDAPADQRLRELAQYRDDLLRSAKGQEHSGCWPDVFDPLSRMVSRHALPLQLLEDLLDAFCQDVVFTAQGLRYQTDAELLAYCRLSANPVGRLLLHLYRINDAAALEQSDAVCTALQLINFWQDLGRDIAHARWYPSVQAMQHNGLTESALREGGNVPGAQRMICTYAQGARQLMLRGAPLARRIPGRAGWELRLVIQGGLRILEKMRAIDYATWRSRP